MATIRIAKEADTTAILAIYAPHILNTAVSFENTVPTIPEFWGRIQKILETDAWLVCELNGEVAGYAYSCLHREREAYQWTKEVSLYVSDRFQRLGIGHALYTTLFELLKAQGICNVLAGITLPNPKSQALHESMGFKKVGTYKGIGYKLGSWQDTGWWELRLRSVEDGPAPIKAFRELEGTDDWRNAVDLGLARLA